MTVLPALVLGCLLPGARAASAPYGILLMAHGGEPAWNAEVEAIRRRLDASVPTETALGMADPEALQGAIARLEARSASRIVAVPLFISSSSEVLDQTRYVLGLQDKPSEVLRKAFEAMAHEGAGAQPEGHAHHHAFSLARVKTGLPVVMTAALDAHPLVAEIVLERAKALSREPGRETVILVGHGPVDDKANEEWLAAMTALARDAKEKGGFKSASAATLRDDSPDKVKAAAAKTLRALVSKGARDGRALVIPYLVARGGIEEHIVSALKGLDYAWDGRTLAPHPNLARWAAETAAAAGENSRLSLAPRGEKPACRASEEACAKEIKP